LFDIFNFYNKKNIFPGKLVIIRYRNHWT